MQLCLVIYAFPLSIDERHAVLVKNYRRIFPVNPSLNIGVSYYVLLLFLYFLIGIVNAPPSLVFLSLPAGPSYAQSHYFPT